MKSLDRATLSLSASALALAVAFSPAAQAQESTQKATPDATQATAPEGAQAATAATAKPFYRKTQTGSHIARVRNDESLPVSEFDRTYIDRTGAATTTDLLRTIPYVQVGR